LGGLPAEVAALLGPLLQMAQGLLLSGASEAEILQMIARLERVLALLVDLGQAMAGAGPEGPRLLARLLRSLALSGSPPAAGEMARLLKALRSLVPQGTEGLDQRVGDETRPAQPVDGEVAVAGLEGWLRQAFPPKA